MVTQPLINKVKTKKSSDDESSDSDCDISKLISSSNKNSMSRLLNILVIHYLRK